MPTIKTKKEMNLPELIEWGFRNEIKNEQYFCKEDNSKSLTFNSYGNVQFSAFYPYLPSDTFKVEVEEEITEDTVFEHIIEVRGSDHATWNNTSIADEKLPNSTQFYAYIDEEYKLIWRGGKLVD